MAECLYGPKTAGGWPATGLPLTGGTSPTTAKGDLIVRGPSVDARLPVGTNDQRLIADSTQTLGVKWADDPNGFAFKSALMNANFAVNQRVYVSGTATTVANQYTLDRWRVVTSGQNLTFSTLANGRQITAPAGGVEQVIEGANVKGGTYALSWTGTATATVNGSAVTNGGTVVLTAATNATVRFSGGTVAYAQLELGSSASEFAPVPFEVELQRCMRYYEKSVPHATVPATGVGNSQRMSGVAYSTTQMRISNTFQVPKRSTPTIVTLAGTTGSGSQWSFYNGSSYVGGTVSNMVGFERGFYCDLGGTATQNASYIVEGNWTADAEL